MKADPEGVQTLIDELHASIAGKRGQPPSAPPLPPRSGDGSSPSMDPWRESVDRQLSQLHSDVRALLNRGVLCVVGLAAMIAGLYLYTNEKFEAAEARNVGMERRLSSMEVQQAKSDATLNGKLDLLLDRKQAPSR